MRLRASRVGHFRLLALAGAQDLRKGLKSLHMVSHWRGSRPPASSAAVGTVTLPDPAVCQRQQLKASCPGSAFRIPRQHQRRRRLTVKALDAPVLSTLTLGQSVPLWVPALVALWPVSQVAAALQNWTRGFRLCHPLPGTPESKSPWRSLAGDLKQGLSPQIHREFTALAEQFGGVFHTRILWRQVHDACFLGFAVIILVELTAPEI